MKRIFILMVVGVFFILILGAAGCNSPADSERDTGTPPTSSDPGKVPVKVILYFSDDQSTHLVAEEREVVPGDKTLEEVIINELIKGPGEPGHSRTIPEGTRLLSVSVEEGVAYVNFSREFAANHWGGSTGESHTLMSVTNSLCQLEEIDKVQFLLEGDTMETLVGHWDTSQPLSPRKI